MQLVERIGRWLEHASGRGDANDEQQQFGHLLASLVVMAWFVEARDPYTGGHLWRRGPAQPDGHLHRLV